jgi:hypothetical protein
MLVNEQIPIDGYILERWGQKGVYRATAFAYMQREKLDKVTHNNGQTYTFNEIESAMIGYKPSTLEEKYPHVFNNEFMTRKVIREKAENTPYTKRNWSGDVIFTVPCVTIYAKMENMHGAIEYAKFWEYEHPGDWKTEKGIVECYSFLTESPF